jgi:hypothetical protein
MTFKTIWAAAFMLGAGMTMHAISPSVQSLGMIGLAFLIQAIAFDQMSTAAIQNITRHLGGDKSGDTEQSEDGGGESDTEQSEDVGNNSCPESITDTGDNSDPEQSDQDGGNKDVDGSDADEGRNDSANEDVDGSDHGGDVVNED